MSQLISTEAEQTRAHVTAESRALKNHITADLEVNAAHADSQHQGTREHVTLESSRIIQHLDNDRRSAALRREGEDIPKRILSTLWFPEMNARENSIHEASKDTVRWIFNHEPFTSRSDSGNEVSILDDNIKFSCPSSNRSNTRLVKPTQFRQWLEAEGSVFWILGKAGSSKSTVMRFLVRSQETFQCLNKWRPSVTICRFFFIETCTNPLQRQLRGCLRTLLYQVINLRPHVLEQLLQSRPELSEKHSEYDWSLNELENVLLAAFRADKSAFCLFIDALDEMENTQGDRGLMIKLLSQLGDLPNVKICVSSRPENPFTHAVRAGPYPSLQTERLTHSAIELFVTRKLKPYKYTLSRNDQAYKKLIDEIVEKASGVFLWVVLAIQSVLRGVMNGDNWDILYQRIRELDDDIYGLFKQMLQRQDADWKHYKEDTATLLWHALYTAETRYYDDSKADTLLSYIFGTHDVLSTKTLESFVTRSMSVDKEFRISQEYEKWLSARSAGLLEIVRKREGESMDEVGFYSQVSFIHRSVREFLCNTMDGHEILLFNKTSSKQRLLRSLEATKHLCHALIEQTKMSTDLLPDFDRHQDRILKIYIRSIIALQCADYIDASEVRNHFLTFRSMVQSQDSIWFPDENLVKGAISWGSVVLLSPQDKIMFNDFLPRERSVIFYSALYNMTDFPSAISRHNSSPIDIGIELEADLTGANRPATLSSQILQRVDIIKWLLCASSDLYLQKFEVKLGSSCMVLTIFHKLFTAASFLLQRQVRDSRNKETDLKSLQALYLDCLYHFKQYGSDWDQALIHFQGSSYATKMVIDATHHQDIGNNFVFGISAKFLVDLLFDPKNFGFRPLTSTERIHHLETIPFVDQVDLIAIRPYGESSYVYSLRTPNPKETERKQRLEAGFGELFRKQLISGEYIGEIGGSNAFDRLLEENADALYFYE